MGYMVKVHLFNIHGVHLNDIPIDIHEFHFIPGRTLSLKGEALFQVGERCPSDHGSQAEFPPVIQEFTSGIFHLIVHNSKYYWSFLSLSNQLRSSALLIFFLTTLEFFRLLTLTRTAVPSGFRRVL